MDANGMSRREFLASSAATLGALGMVGSVAKAAQADVDEVVLGSTGIRTSRLGLGTGTFGGREQRLLGSEGFARLVHEAYDRGVRFIDCSDSYWTHGLIRHALEGLPRESLFIQTKTDARDAALVRSDIDRFLIELDVEYIDSVLMHCMTAPSFVDDLRPAIDVLLEAKASGMVRAIGASYHSVDAPAAAASCADLDIHMIRVTPFSVNTGGPADRVAEVARELADAGKGVIGMKVYGESGFGSPEERRESIHHVVSLGSVHAFAIGFRDIAQIEETLGHIAAAVG